jgi:hypothetical protein
VVGQDCAGGIDQIHVAALRHLVVWPEETLE